MWTDTTVRVIPIHDHVERRGSQERGQGGSESPGHQESLTRKHSLLPSLPWKCTIRCAGSKQKNLLWQAGGEHGTSLLSPGWAPEIC